jgi:ABC-type transport system involved in multi-copper enzyme maturation permease subunit
MAIYDQSYAPWTGTYASRATRIRSIVEMELAQPFKNIWVLLIVLLAFALVLGWLLILFLVGSVQLNAIPAFALGNKIYRDGFFNFPPGSNFTLYSMILMVLSATVGSTLIARDSRHRALLMYFSRSITRIDYMIGKFLSLFLFLLFVTLGPGLILFIGQLGMGSERLTFAQRMSDLLGVTLHSLIMTVPVSAVVLAFSSLTKRAYLAAIGWSMFYLASETASSTLAFALKADWAKALSWTNLTTHLASYCYVARAPSDPVLKCGWGVPLAVLLALTGVSLAIVWWRLRSVEVEE